MVKKIYCTSCQGENPASDPLKDGGDGTCPQCGFKGTLLKKTKVTVRFMEVCD